MIKTNKYNEFILEKYDTQYKPEEVIAFCKDFVNNGGDLKLPILHHKEIYNPIDFFAKKMGLGMGFITLLENENLLKENKIVWNPETKEIDFKQEYSLGWFLQEGNEAELIKEFSSLIKILPKSIHEIKKINTKSYTDFSNRKPQIISLLKRALNPNLWDLSIKHFDDLKSFIRDDIDAVPADYLEFGYGYKINSKEINAIFFRENLISYKILKENLSLTCGILIGFLLKNDLENIKKTIDKINELGINQNELSAMSNSENFFTYSKSKEASDLLLKNKFPTHHIKTNTHFVFLSGFDNSAIESILDDEKEKSILMDNLKDFLSISKIMENSKNFLDLAIMIKQKTNLDFSKSYLFNIISKKNGDNYEDAKRDYEKLVSNGVEVTFSNEFFNQVVYAREDGLKKIRNYKKLGIVDIKSPEFINGFLNHDFGNTLHPMTKIFYNFFDKTYNKDDFAQTTKYNKPVWWDINNGELFKYVTKNLDKDDLLKSSDVHVNFLTYFMHKCNTSFNKNEKNVIDSYWEKIEKNNLKDELKNNLIKSDSFGNNFFHYYMDISKSKKYGRQLVHIEISKYLDFFKEDFAFLLTNKNNKGQTPIDILLTKDENIVSIQVFLNWIKQNKENCKINYLEKTQKGNPIYIDFTEVLNKIGDDDFAKEILREGSYLELQKKLKNEKPNKPQLKV